MTSKPEIGNIAIFGSLTVHFVARVGAVVTLIVIFVGSTLGRLLQREYPDLVSLIPYAGIVLILGALLLAIRMTMKLIDHRPVRMDRDKLLKLSGFTLLVTFLVIAACENLIVLPIERVHFLKYGTLAFFFYFSQKKIEVRSKLLTAGICASLVGCAEEVSQIFIPDRFFDFRDILLNASASVFGTVYAWIIVLWKRLLVASVEG